MTDQQIGEQLVEVVGPALAQGSATRLVAGVVGDGCG